MPQRWPEVYEHQYYVRDRFGVIWFADTQFGFGVVTAVTSQGTISAALTKLRDLRGPLHILKDLGPEVLDQLPTIEPEQNLLEAQQSVLAVTEADSKRLS